MANIEFLSAVTKSLASHEEERREAVGLLLELSNLSAIRRQIGRIKGCIVMLVSILNGIDPVASHDAAKLLDILSNNTQNVLHMAEAGYFRQLVQCLKKGNAELETNIFICYYDMEHQLITFIKSFSCIVYLNLKDRIWL